MAALLERHAGILLDAYGVLVDGSGPLPGALELLGHLEARAVPYAIVTNDASRSPATYEARFAALGLRVPPERFVTSGSLLPGFFRARGLSGARTCVLGTPDSESYVREGGGVVVAVERGMTIDAVAVCDDSGTPFLHGIELAFSAIARAIDDGRRPVLVLPNPDLVYPKGGCEYGFTAGSMALLIEAALARRFPTAGLVFERLGKPGPALFTEAARRLGIAPARLVMIGDQLETDIAGASAAGIPACLTAGVSRWDASVPSPAVPTYLLPDLHL